MIQSMYRRPTGEWIKGLEPDELHTALEDPGGLLWVYFGGDDEDTARNVLLETFHFHPLAVDDALDEIHVPKVDSWDGYLYLVLHAIHIEPDGDRLLSTNEVDFFIGPNYLVTYSVRPIPALQRVWDSIQHNDRNLAGNVERLLYQICDELVVDTMPIIEFMDDAIDELEDAIFSHPSPNVLSDIFRYKRAMLQLRRILMPQREVINRLARGDLPVLSVESRMFFRDVYDHLVRIYDISEGMRDLVNGALDMYLSVSSNRMNEVMKALTIITTLFMPLAFLTGFFGMNFFQPTADFLIWTAQPAFYALLAGIVLFPTIMFLWMRRRSWM